MDRMNPGLTGVTPPRATRERRKGTPRTGRPCAFCRASPGGYPNSLGFASSARSEVIFPMWYQRWVLANENISL